MSNKKEKVYAVSVGTKINFFDNIVASSKKEAEEIVLRKFEEDTFDYVISGLLSDYTQRFNSSYSEILQVLETHEDVDCWKVAS